jgi:hypothetical protein
MLLKETAASEGFPSLPPNEGRQLYSTPAAQIPRYVHLRHHNEWRSRRWTADSMNG